MHLLIAREAVDQHLQVAGDILEGDGALADEGQDRRQAPASSTRKWLPQLAVGEGTSPAPTTSSARWPTHLRFVERALAQAGPLDVLRDEPLAGQAREEAGVPRPHRRHRRRAVRDRRRRASTRTRSSASTRSAREQAFELADLFCPQARRRVDRLFDELWANDDDANYKRRAGRARRPLRVARGGRRRPVRRRPDDRRSARLGRRSRQRLLKSPLGRGLPPEVAAVLPSPQRACSFAP